MRTGLSARWMKSEYRKHRGCARRTPPGQPTLARNPPWGQFALARSAGLDLSISIRLFTRFSASSARE